MLGSDWAQRLTGWIPAPAAAKLAGYRRDFAERAAHWRAFLEASPQPDLGRWPARWLRPKGHVSRGTLLVLLTLALLPLLSMIVRILAWPGVLGDGAGGTWLQSLGYDLNQLLSLRRIPPGEREYVLYVLFVPTGAVLIALARLTFGIRVIGFRAILIAVGFQQSGIIPSIVLIAVVTFVIAGVRPFLMKMHLKHYARVAVIMSISVLLLLGALLVAPWVQSEVLWSVAFFPVIVLGIMAEGIARTIDQDSGLTAFWRTGTTIAIALLLAAISHLPLLREIAIEFPELVLTQIVLIILIAEYLDLELLQEWDAKLSRMAPPRLFAAGSDSALRIAVVRNRDRSNIIGRLGVPSLGGYRRGSIRRIVEGLRQAGHTVEVVEGDMSLLSSLREFIPPHLLSGEPGGIALNLAHGIQGDVAVAHVPAMLEMAGVAYTGPTPLGHTCMQDRVLTRTLLRQAGIATADLRVVGDAAVDTHGLQYPVIVRPRIKAGRRGRIAYNRQQLLDILARLGRRDGQACVVEPVFSGREIEVAILGNAPSRCLPLVELHASGAGRICPAALDPALAATVRATALAAFQACHCRDYALVTVRITPAGVPVVLDVDTSGVLEDGEAFELAAAAAGLTFTGLVEGIVAIARDRYRPEPGLTGRAVTVAGEAAGGRNGERLVAG